ncbi:MAG: PHB depolymerase family esterase [Agarilytica sp.]
MKIIQSTLLAIISLSISLGTQAAWQSETVIGGKLNTILYVPTTTPLLSNKRALMVSLPGCGQTNEQLKEGANWPSTADAYGMVVALPDPSREGSYGGLGCWNFHVGMSMSRNSSDAKYILNLVDALLNNTSLNIDPTQVYLSGLSSGGGMTASLACLAPEVFAGAGVNAGPGPGSNGQSLNSANISVNQGVSNCKTLSNKDGANSQSSLYTQIHSTICGANDTTVAPVWCDRVSDIMAATYDEDTPVSDCSGGSNPTSISGGGVVNTFCDADGPRSSNIIVTGMGHAWPAGPGSSGGGNYVDHTHVNYPEYVTAFFFDNNRRVVTNASPDISGLSLSEGNSIITVSGTALDNDGSVASVTVAVTNTTTGQTVDTLNLNVDGSGYFVGDTVSLADANYTATVTVTDNDGASSSDTASIWVGPIPPNSAPTITNVSTAVAGACVTVTGTVADIDGNLGSANATFDGSLVVPISVTNASATNFSIEECSLAYGSHSVVISGTDTASPALSTSSASTNFTTVNLGKTGDINYHLAEGTITYGAGYSWCYTAYSGSTSFTMIEEETSGGNCRWVDEAGANNCAGPEQACSTGPAPTPTATPTATPTPTPTSTPTPTPTPTPVPNCEEVSAYNYYHKTGGRAYSTGSTWSPSYFANGSDDTMSGSTWGYNTLHSDNGSYWELGGC